MEALLPSRCTIVPNRPDGRMKPGELQNGGYGFYYKGQPSPVKQDVLQDLQAVIQPIQARPRTTQPAEPYKEVITSPVYFTNEKWQEVLASHGLIIDPTTKTLTVQSASSPADLQYDLKPEELKILTSNSLKEIPLEQRLGTLNGIIKEDFAGSFTMDVLNSKESVNIPLTDKARPKSINSCVLDKSNNKDK